MSDRNPNYYSFMISPPTPQKKNERKKEREFGVAKSEAIIQMDDIIYLVVHVLKLQKNAFKISCCYFMKIPNDG